MYRVVVGSSGCNTVYSTVATLSIHNLWTGITSTDWNTATNWSGNVLPSVSCPDVDIPAGTPNQPILSNAPIATITNIHIFSGATLTVNSTGILQIAGTITNGGTFDVSRHESKTTPKKTFMQSTNQRPGDQQFNCSRHYTYRPVGCLRFFNLRSRGYTICY